MHLAFYKLYYSNLFIYFLLVIGTVLTVIYSGRLLYLVFFISVNLFKVKVKKFHDFSSNKKVFFGFFILCFLSIVSGYVFKEVFCGIGSDYFFNSILLLPYHYYFDYIFVDCLFFKNLPFICFLAGLLYFLPLLKNFIYNIDFNFYFLKDEKLVFLFLNKKFFFDEFYNYFIVWPIYKTCFLIFNFFERGILLVIGPNGLFNFFFVVSVKISYLFTTSKIYIYTFIINLFFVLLVVGVNVVFSFKNFDFTDTDTLLNLNSIKDNIASQLKYILKFGLYPRLDGVLIKDDFVYLGSVLECDTCETLAKKATSSKPMICPVKFDD